MEILDCTVCSVIIAYSTGSQPGPLTPLGGPRDINPPKGPRDINLPRGPRAQDL